MSEEKKEEVELNVQLFCDTLARIIGDRYGVKIRTTVIPKADTYQKAVG